MRMSPVAAAPAMMVRHCQQPTLFDTHDHRVCLTRPEHSGSVYGVSVSGPEPYLQATAGDDETVCMLLAGSPVYPAPHACMFDGTTNS